MVSVFGRRADVEGPEGYVFFAADSQHPSYQLVQNVVSSQMYVSEFRLDGYPVAPDDVLHTGAAAFDAALNTVNIGKFNLGFASIGICEHAFYEAVTHADGRVLYGKRVTDFPHVRQGLTDAYARLAAMKLFGERAIDYVRSASADDRRYLLFNPVTKMKVTTEGERVIDLLWDVVAAKGFEKDTYFEHGGEGHPRPAEARGHRARQHGPGAEVHAELPAAADLARRRAAATRLGRRRVPLPPGTGPRPRQGPVRGLANVVRRVRRRAERGAVP